MTLWVRDKLHTKGIRLETTPDLEADLTEGSHSVTASQYWCRGILLVFKAELNKKTAWPR